MHAPWQGKQRDTLSREQKRLEECQQDADLIKATLSRAANDLAAATSSNKFSRDDLEKQRSGMLLLGCILGMHLCRKWMQL